jgi:hypothetical protein
MRASASPVHPRAHLDLAERRMEAHAIADAAILSESAGIACIRGWTRCCCTRGWGR